MLQNQKQVKKKFLHLVETTVAEANIGYIEAIVMLCEKHSLDIEQAASYCMSDKAIREKIEADAQGLNLLRKD